MYCSKPAHVDEKHLDNNISLHAAGSKKNSSDYVNKFNKTLRKRATKLGNMKLLALLYLDVRSSE